MSYSPASRALMGNDLLPECVVEACDDVQTGLRARSRRSVRPLRRPPALARWPGVRRRARAADETLDIAAPAVRTAVSRMVRQGWLRPLRLPQGAGYGLTPKCVRRLDEAALRIYRAGTLTWHGRWHVIVFEPVKERPRRSGCGPT
ncbi:hypothetical protein ACFQ0B_19715 [Nonomuraea thailandensis]